MIDTVEQIMTKKIFVIDISSPLLEAKKKFDTHPIRYLPVVSKNKLVGILSKTDIMRLSFGDIYGSDETSVDASLFDMLSIEDVMTHRPKIISPSDSINKVTAILVKEEFHALPVLDNETLVGVITTTNVIEYLINKLEANEIPEKYSEQRPWGNFEQFCLNSPCTVKIINVNPGEELSLQYHKHRSEFWRVIQGEGVVIINEEELIANQGDEFIIPVESNHQIKTKNNPLQILEISFGNFDEKDIIRLEDKYQRKNKEENIQLLLEQKYNESWH